MFQHGIERHQDVLDVLVKCVVVIIIIILDFRNAKVVRDAVTQKSKNYGFISFSSKPVKTKLLS